MDLKITRKTIFKRCMGSLCPNCGQSKISKSLIAILDNCPRCGMLIKRSNGFFFGPICINYGIVAFILICPILILGFSELIHINLALSLAFIMSFTFPIFFYSASWSLWLLIYYLCLPKELYNNRAEGSDDLLFDEDERL